jgi:phosphate starvation-inducible protein PhoH
MSAKSATTRRSGSRRQNQRQSELVLINNNVTAIKEGPTQKHWTKHDLKIVRPLTENQHDMFRQYFQGDNIVAFGSAGTGKSFLALYLALCDILDGNKPQERIIIVRSAVTTRELGFMPGSLDEKIALFETPYKDILQELFGRINTYENMKEADLIRFTVTSYIRGITWDNAVIIVDEGQNMTDHEIHSIMTRVGTNSRVVFTGDLAQNDLVSGKRAEKSGMKRLLKVIERMPEFSTVCFTTEDIVRSDFVKSWIVASEQVGPED